MSVKEGMPLCVECKLLKIRMLLCCCLCLGVAWAEEEAPQNRGDGVPAERTWAENEYLEGYLQALVDIHFHEYRVCVRADGDVIYLSNLPANRLLERSICCFVQDFPGVSCVVVEDPLIESGEIEERCYPEHPLVCMGGVWFPQSAELFAPLVADPRQIRFSLGWRFHDEVFDSAIASPTFGDTFPIYRWFDVGPWHGDAQVGVEGGVFAVFQFCPELRTSQGDEIALVNADYYVGIPITYAAGCWSYRLRLYHVSSHLGDEYMVTHPDVVRLNPSREAIDLFASLQLAEQIRLYGGVGVNVHSNRDFHIDPLYFEYGFELRLLGRRCLSHCLYFQPYIAAHFRNWQDVKFHPDATYVAGIELSKLQGVGRKIRAYVEWHDGFSLEGQFMKMRTEYLAINLSFGF